MTYDIKIRESYHGTGGRDGYRYKVYNNNGKKLGELKKVPSDCGVDDTVTINGEVYIVTDIYNSNKPREERSEVVYIELQKYILKPDYDFGDIMKVSKSKNNKEVLKP